MPDLVNFLKTMAIWLTLAICIFIDLVVTCSDLPNCPLALLFLNSCLSHNSHHSFEVILIHCEENGRLLIYPAPGRMSWHWDNGGKGILNEFCCPMCYQHNLIGDLVSMHVWEVLIQFHWGWRGKSPCFRAQPPSVWNRGGVSGIHIQSWGRMINDQDSWYHWQLLVTLHTKAITLVTLAASGNIWPHAARPTNMS